MKKYEIPRIHKDSCIQEVQFQKERRTQEFAHVARQSWKGKVYAVFETWPGLWLAEKEMNQEDPVQVSSIENVSAFGFQEDLSSLRYDTSSLALPR